MEQSNISVLDDNKEIIKILKIIFKVYPEYKFSYFIDGNVFINNINENLDLALIDIHVPGFNIIEAVKMINIKSPRAYIIVMSADRNWEVLVQLINLNIFCFCEKGTNSFVENVKEAVARAHCKIEKRKGIFIGT